MEKEEVIHSEAALTAAVQHAVANIKVWPAPWESHVDSLPALEEMSFQICASRGTTQSNPVRSSPTPTPAKDPVANHTAAPPAGAGCAYPPLSSIARGPHAVGHRCAPHLPLP